MMPILSKRKYDDGLVLQCFVQDDRQMMPISIEEEPDDRLMQFLSKDDGSIMPISKPSFE